MFPVSAALKRMSRINSHNSLTNVAKQEYQWWTVNWHTTV